MRISRRTFLAVGPGLVLAGSAARTGSASEAARRMTMDLVCGALGVNATQLEAVAFAEKYGFESVAPDAPFLKGLSDSELRDFLGSLSDKGLVLSAAGLPVEFRKSEESFKDDVRKLADFARTLERAEVRRVGTWIMPMHNELTYLENFKLHTRRLSEVAAILEQRRVRLGLEYVGPRTLRSRGRYPFVHSMTEMKELLAAIGRPNVGMVLDSWHWYTAGETEEDLLTLNSSQVVAVDLNDAPAGIPADQQEDSVRRLPCSTGVIDVGTFLRALVTIGYDGPVRAEPFDAELRKKTPEEAVAETAKAMKQAFNLLGEERQ